MQNVLVLLTAELLFVAWLKKQVPLAVLLKALCCAADGPVCCAAGAARTECLAASGASSG